MVDLDSKHGNFADKLFNAVIRKKSPVIAGIDPRLDLFPQSLLKNEEELEPIEYRKSISETVLEYTMNVIAAVNDFVAGVKFQMAYFELLGWHGIEVLERVTHFAKTKNLVVILDGKRNDIGTTSEAYARSYLGGGKFSRNRWENDYADSLTVNPYLGSDGISPFIIQAKKYGKGIFVLVKTSNPSSNELQDLAVLENKDSYPLHEAVALLVKNWGKDLTGKHGYSSVGAVVGATYPSIGRRLRKLMPFTPFLVPGFGAQGASANDVVVNFDSKGLGAVVNSSRKIYFAFRYFEDFSEENYAEASRYSAKKTREEIRSVLESQCVDLEY